MRTNSCKGGGVGGFHETMIPVLADLSQAEGNVNFKMGAGSML